MTKIDFTKPVQTRDGRPVRILCTERKHDSYPVVGLIEICGKECFYTWDLNGRYCEHYNNNNLDLVNVPEKKTVYQFTVYSKKRKKVFTTNNESKEEAEASFSIYKTYGDCFVVTGIQEVTFEVPND